MIPSARPTTDEFHLTQDLDVNPQCSPLDQGCSQEQNTIRNRQALCFTREKAPNVHVTRTEPIFTPYIEYPLNPEDASIPEYVGQIRNVQPKRNFRLVELFALRINVQSLLSSMNPSLTVSPLGYPFGKIKKIALVIHEGGIIKDINKKEATVIKRFMDDSLRLNESKTNPLCVVFSPDHNILYKGITLPRPWLYSILPYIGKDLHIGQVYQYQKQQY